MSTLAASFEAVRARMADAAGRSGRKPEDICLVAVSKSVSVDKVKQAQTECDQHLFGENRADELVRKAEVCPDADFHYVGTLQTNKVRKVVGVASLIHSVDSERLLRAIDARAKLQSIKQPVLMQVSISGEEAKQGIEPSQLDALLHLANSELAHIQVNGLMTMAPFAPAGDIRWIFEDLRKLRDKSVQDGPSVSLSELSMGMTGDFEVAIEEGATLVRVGTALFAA
ncbi:MAG: YggS family pyridoxal phosphate-dependent enzyme [Coriobacteriia bacterium]|nr:YggS family pyridoxal phosphate-dependent enzyme [Coriobacteriia bacterium]